MAELKYITLFLDRQKEFNMLSDEQAGKLIKGIFEYGATGEELNSDDLTVNILFSVIKAQLDEVANKYDEKCRKNKEIATNRERKKRESKSTNVDERADVDEDEHERSQESTNVHERVISSTKSTNTKTNTKTKTKTNNNADALLYGTFSNVSLTKEEHSKLVNDYGRNRTEEYIDRVDTYCERTGKSYPDCYLTIREWMRKDGIAPSDTAKYNCLINRFPELPEIEVSVNEETA